jgi:hypothetical protein
MAFDARVLLTLTANLTSPLDLTTASAPLSYSKQYTITQGSGLNQSDRIFHDQRTITASGNDDIDLAGVLTDPFGAIVTFARIKGILISAATGNTNTVIAGGGTNFFTNWLAGTTPTVVLRPGGLLFVLAPDATGYPVTAGTADIFRVTNGGAGTSVTYDIVLFGAST